MDKMAEIKKLKTAAAAKALEFVRPDMCLGIGTGSTAEEFILLLAEKVRQGFSVIGISTSERSRAFCAECGVPVGDFDQNPQLDMTIDGADELDSQLQLIKGGGGALLREKITAYASKQMIVIADESKLVRQLGRFPLPIEVNPFGLRATEKAIAAATAALGLKGVLKLRVAEDRGGKKSAAREGILRDPAGLPFITDGGHYILDAHFQAIPDTPALAAALCAIPGVVEHGLFFHPNCRAVIAQKSGAVTIISGRSVPHKH